MIFPWRKKRKLPRIVTRLLSLCLLLALGSAGLLGAIAYRATPLLKTTIAELDKLEKSNPAELIAFFHTKTTDDNVRFALFWLENIVDTTHSFVPPFLYSEIRADQARANRDTLSPKDYDALMTQASTLFIFADLTAFTDFARCTDTSAAVGLLELRHMFGPTIYHYLETSADDETKKRILTQALLMEQKIESRPPNPTACAYGAAARQGKKIDYLDTDIWKGLRLQKRHAYIQAYMARFLSAK